MRKTLKVVFLDGPGDAIESFRFWAQGIVSPNVTHIAFSQQFFTACQSVRAKVLVIAEHARIDRLVSGDFILEHRGDPARGKSGMAYHLAMLARGAALIRDIIVFRADVVVSTDRPYPFLLHVLRLFRVKIIINMHCVLWCNDSKPTGGVSYILNRLNGHFFRTGCIAIACVSQEIKLQIRQLTTDSNVPFVDFLPWLPAHFFANITPPRLGEKVFHIMFAGRIEENKGVFDLLDIADRFRAENRTNVVFDICGAGSALPELVEKTRRMDLDRLFIIHGYCDRTRMIDMFNRSYFVVVPTRSSFNEGFNMVIAEALLAKRPVITSKVCPAVAYVADAVVLAKADDAASYAKAICRLVDDEAAYIELQAKSYDAGLRFTKKATSYQAAFDYILPKILRGERIASREIDPSNVSATI